MRDFEKRNPNLKVMNAVLHLDESCPHLHIDFVPICHSPDRGLSTRVSMKGALREMGFSSSNKKQNEWVAWEKSEMEYMTEILHRHNLERDVKNNSLGHLPVEDFKAKKAAEAEKEKLEAALEILHRTPPEQIISAEDLFLIKNENDLLREENYKIATTAKKILDRQHAQFVELEIFNPDKLEYVCGVLRHNKVPFIEEICSVYLPDYALNFAHSLSEKYKPTPPLIRNRVKLDIDRLILSADSFEDLLEKLKMLGYEIKQGKYTSIKPPFGERNVRIEKLGEEYSRENIEHRISEAKADLQAAREANENKSSLMAGVFLNTRVKLMLEVTALKIYPEKFNADQPYSFRNDARIELWTRQLATMNEFGISSRAAVENKAAGLESRIESYSKINVDVSKEREQLARVHELIKVYEVVVKGNFIDNLIKAENERNAAEQRAAEQRKAAAERRQQAQQGITNEHKEEQKPTQNNVKKSTKHRR